ncbi:uncharacterized protein (DUF1684 family) [Catenulispora sp. EB89]|uniref:DUF1684 domain-containing protein n=1 Tax=Catenulispora sp. EB89 TaxID=3156257 RepID=UPI00351103E6
MPETEPTTKTRPAPAEWNQWAEKRDASVSAEFGVLALVATHWLEDGAATRIDGLPGVWAADEARASVTVTATSGDALLVEDVPVDGVRLLNPDLAADPTVLFHHGRKLVPIVREGALAVRVYDPEAANRRGFAGIERFPYDPALVFEARYEPYVHGHVERVLNADGKERGLALDGDLVFEHDGAEYRLAVTEGSDGFDVTFGDGTNGPDTFGFRQLAVAAPESGSGTTRLDFNRAQLPPCAFSDHFICPVPPVGNRLELAVAAGEKRRAARP